MPSAVPQTLATCTTVTAASCRSPVPVRRITVSTMRSLRPALPTATMMGPTLGLPQAPEPQRDVQGQPVHAVVRIEAQELVQLVETLHERVAMHVELFRGVGDVAATGEVGFKRVQQCRVLAPIVVRHALHALLITVV